MMEDKPLFSKQLTKAAELVELTRKQIAGLPNIDLIQIALIGKDGKFLGSLSIEQTDSQFANIEALLKNELHSRVERYVTELAEATAKLRK